MKSFHNTIEYPEHQAYLSKLRTTTQEYKVLQIFLASPYEALTPCEVWAKFPTNRGVKPPLTSIRRAISNLSHDSVGILLKTDLKKKGVYGEMNFCWRLNIPADGQLNINYNPD